MQNDFRPRENRREELCEEFEYSEYSRITEYRMLILITNSDIDT